MSTAVGTRRPLVELVGVSKTFRVRLGSHGHGQLRAVDDVDLLVEEGATVGLVGESGSGKSTVARLALRLVDPTSGRVRLAGTDITHVKGRELRSLRQTMQLVFQDPNSFDPLASIGDSIAEALRTHQNLDRDSRRLRIEELFNLVGLSRRLTGRNPRELSGGQLQRASLARALAVGARFIALDEPVSSLDASTQAQVVNLLVQLQRELGVAYLFITHDLSLVGHVSNGLAVMYLGRIVEIGPSREILASPLHPYTRALLSALPVADPSRRRTGRIVLTGDIPSPLNPPSGCRFRTRCPAAMSVCSEVDPAPVTVGTVTVRCHLFAPEPVAASFSSPIDLNSATDGSVPLTKKEE
jgi:oligopeptide transport system ATP-binding protein